MMFDCQQFYWMLGIMSPVATKRQPFFVSPSESSFNEDSLEGIPKLYSKLKELNSQLEIQCQVSSPKIFNYDKGKELDTIFDNTMKKAKLKQIENNASLQRANMELRMRKSKFTDKKHPYSTSFNKNKYLERLNSKEISDMFENFKKQHMQDKQARSRMNRETSASYEQLYNNQGTIDGITFYHYLKKHPHLLNFTIENARSKELQKEHQLNAKKEEAHKFAQEIDQYSLLFKKSQSVTLQPESPDPAIIVENKRRRLFTKAVKKNLLYLETATQISDFRHEQNKILWQKARKLSYDNQNKLKEKLDGLALEIYHCRRPFSRDAQPVCTPRIKQRHSKQSKSGI